MKNIQTFILIKTNGLKYLYDVVLTSFLVFALSFESKIGKKSAGAKKIIIFLVFALSFESKIGEKKTRARRK